ncbi:hypothetical protein BH23ACT1_BH23ACT1_09230 [soil metagenome]
MGEIGYQPQVEEAVPSADGESVSLSEVAGPDRLLEPGEDPHAHEEQERTTPKVRKVTSRARWSWTPTSGSIST